MSRICLARAAGGATPYAAIADAIATGGFDPADVLVPPGLHASAAEPLLQAGIPVLLEKPLAADSAQCDALPAVFADPRVAPIRCDIRDPVSVAAAIGPAKTVINLTHGRGAEIVASACDAPGAKGRAFNVVDEVRATIRQYVTDIGATLGRPLRFYPQSPIRLWFIDMTPAFDVTDTRQALGWAPVANPAAGFGCAFAVQVLPE